VSGYAECRYAECRGTILKGWQLYTGHAFIIQNPDTCKLITTRNAKEAKLGKLVFTRPSALKRRGGQGSQAGKFVLARPSGLKKGWARK
jgi:hypothetical protein